MSTTVSLPVSSDATRGGIARAITTASGATYRSLTHRSSASPRSSKDRTGDTTFRTGHARRRVVGRPEDPARGARPWNGTCTSEPIPASSSAGART